MKEHFMRISKNFLIQVVAISIIFLIVVFFYKTADSNSLEELSSETDVLVDQIAMPVSDVKEQAASDLASETASDIKEQATVTQSISNLDEDKMQALLLQMEKVVKQMSGEGMITLVEEDMLDILSKNENLAKENERLVNELAKAKELLAKQSQREQEILAIADKLMKLDSDSKTQEQQVKDIPSPSKATISGSGAIEGVSKIDNKTKLPFTIVSLAEDYIVVEKLGGGYDSVEIGESVRGQVLLGIDVMKRILTTDKGEFELRKIPPETVKPEVKLETPKASIPKTEQRAIPKIPLKEKLKTFPYKVLGMGSGFIVVEHGKGNFRTVKEGESLEFIDKNVKATKKLTILKVNTAKSSIKTDLGNFTFSFEKPKE